MANRMIADLEIKEYEVTPEGMEELQAELAALRRSRSEIAGEIREISSQSNSTGSREDSTFIITQNRATELDDRIDHLERIIRLAKVIAASPGTDQIGLGSKVSVKIGGKEQCYMVVSPVEADPVEGKISQESPVGSSLIGKKVHDVVKVMTPKYAEMTLTVTAIE